MIVLNWAEDKRHDVYYDDIFACCAIKCEEMRVPLLKRPDTIKVKKTLCRDFVLTYV